MMIFCRFMTIRHHFDTVIILHIVFYIKKKTSRVVGEFHGGARGKYCQGIKVRTIYPLGTTNVCTK